MSRRALLLIPAVVLLAAAAGCGGGGGKPSDSSSGAEPGEQSEIGDAASAEGAAGGETGEPAESGAPAEDPGLAPGDGPVDTQPEITFTGVGGESFCSQMTELQASYANSEETEANYSTLADKIAAITPPPELEGDWPEFVDMNRLLANDPSGGELRNASPDSMQRFSEISTKVSEYMAQVCGL
jgi:hypothetical protein